MAASRPGIICHRQPRERAAIVVYIVDASMTSRLRATPYVLLLAVGTAACSARRPPATSANPPTVVSTVAATSIGPALIATALGLRGTPYLDGGSGPKGFDCSGFVQYVFAQHGIVLPRNVAGLYVRGRGISREAILPGDLVFFQTVSPGASHVGIALESGRFIHAPSSTGVVRIEQYTSSYWGPRYIGARRLS